jgi:pimeloyl-ACP methyl ester carboxylesterase
MRKQLLILLAIGFMAFVAESVRGQYEPPEKIFPPSDEVLQQIESKTAQLTAKIAELRKNPKTHDLLPDVEIYLRGARNIVRFKEWYKKESGQWTLDALDAGLQRADQLAQGKSPWTTLEQRNVLRAYRSNIDDTAQPYGVTYPLEYGKDPKRKWRVDVVLHGRDSSLTEVAFIHAHNGKKKVDAEQDWVQVDVFGRGNNAYRWAGEEDVMAARWAFFKSEASEGRDLADRQRVVLRGFSMGGAGTWHLGLHRPDVWRAIGPGAGFTTTHGYAWKGKKELPDYQEKCLRIYDAIEYVENARMIPIVAYSGGDDPQKLAADNIEKRLNELRIDTMTHLVKPGVGHKFEADYFAKANALWSEFANRARLRGPQRISFVTYTTKYGVCDWVGVRSLEKHYEKASVKGEIQGNTCFLTTRNAANLWLLGPLPDNVHSINIDGQEISAKYWNLAKKHGKWLAALQEKDLLKEFAPGFRKVTSSQGPIDDAFASGFVCVKGTGKPWHPATQKFVDAKLDAFKHDWAKHWRGELPITNEYGITPNEIKERHLILFGDPSSNFLLANILPKLPLKWTKDEIEFAGKKYKASEHVPVMIFPNPLNPAKYVVLNTGHTWPSEDYYKTNALLYPRLGDYAILRMTPTGHEVATAGLFDEFWKVK